VDWRAIVSRLIIGVGHHFWKRRHDSRT
jgi:hypothetical protein